MALNTTGTILELVESGIPFYSMRGIQQDLFPMKSIAGNRNNLVTLVSGALLDLTPTKMKKLGSRITGRDASPPAFDSVWPGTVLTVRCCATLRYVSGGSPQRPVVSGSSTTEHGFVIYRPELVMMVMDWSEGFLEWDGHYPWSIEFEEVEVP